MEETSTAGNKVAQNCAPLNESPEFNNKKSTHKRDSTTGISEGAEKDECRNRAGSKRIGCVSARDGSEKKERDEETSELVYQQDKAEEHR